MTVRQGTGRQCNLLSSDGVRHGACGMIGQDGSLWRAARFGGATARLETPHRAQRGREAAAGRRSRPEADDKGGWLAVCSGGLSPLGGDSTQDIGGGACSLRGGPWFGVV